MYKKFIVTLVALIAMACTVLYMKKTGFKIASTKTANIYEAFNLVESDGSHIGENDENYAVVISGILSDYRALLKNNTYYVRYETIRNKITDKFYWDREENFILYTTPTAVVKHAIGGAGYEEGGKSESWDNDITIQVNDDLYLDLAFVSKYTGLDYQVFTNPNRICMVGTLNPLPYAKVEKIDSIRNGADVSAHIYTEAKIGEQVLLTGIEEGDFTEVMTTEGIIGFIKKSSLSEKTEIAAKSKVDLPEYTSLTKDKKISIAWHQVTESAANGSLDEVVSKAKGLNVISPTWLSVKNKKGKLKSIASADYVKKAHDKGLEVWVLVDDFIKTKDGTHVVNEAISKTSSRQRLINNIIKQVKHCKADGINVDFEYIKEEYSDSYIEFLRELSVSCRNDNLVLSADTYVPSDWSKYYRRDAQAEVCDYVVVMAYDEFNGSSTDAGPVSSMSFVENGIKNTVEEVGSKNASKIIAALPFYTRVWTKKAAEPTEANNLEKGQKYIEDKVNGDFILSSKAIGMDTAKEMVEQDPDLSKSLKLDEKTGVNYAFYEDEASGKSTQIWMEDMDSLTAKLELIVNNNIGGAAFWKLSMESDDVWQVINEKLSK